jgi:hypothetical protein
MPALSPGLIEAALVVHLGALLPTLDVRSFPDRPEHFHSNHPVGAVLVCYRGSAWERPEATDQILQARTPSFEATVLVKNLRDHSGAYEVLETLRQGLQGWVPLSGCDPCWIEADGFVHQSEGLWQWRLQVATRYWALEAPAPSLPVPLLTLVIPEESL